jgi:hypothetical protein
MTSDATLEGSGVREGRCRLGVEAGTQTLVMIQAHGQSVTSDCNMRKDVLDLVVWDYAGVVVHLVDEPCDTLQHATNNQKGREVDDIVTRNLGSRTLDREGQAGERPLCRRSCARSPEGTPRSESRLEDRSSVDARLAVSESVTEPVGLAARIREAHEAEPNDTRPRSATGDEAEADGADVTLRRRSASSDSRGSKRAAMRDSMLDRAANTDVRSATGCGGAPPMPLKSHGCCCAACAKRAWWCSC